MNAPFRSPPAKPTPYKFTLEEARRAWDAGVFAGYPDMELIDGVLIEMPADGPRTIDWNARLNRWLIGSTPPGLTVVPDKTLDVSTHQAPKPDFYVHDRTTSADVNGRNVLLVIEVSDSTLESDRGQKARIYAEGGVREYWIADCVERRLLVHRLRDDGTYGEPTSVAFDAEAEALLIPGLKLRLADLGPLP